MIMRTWRGAVRAEDLERYLEHQSGTGVREYRETPGNRGALVLTRPRGNLIEVTTVSFWESMDAVRAFAGDEPERARFYPGDGDLGPRLPVPTRRGAAWRPSRWGIAEKDPHADHYDLVEGDRDQAFLAAP